MCVLEYESRIGVLDVLEQDGVVLAHEVLFVVAFDVVPSDAIAVKVVKHGQTGLVSTRVVL